VGCGATGGLRQWPRDPSHLSRQGCGHQDRHQEHQERQRRWRRRRVHHRHHLLNCIACALRAGNKKPAERTRRPPRSGYGRATSRPVELCRRTKSGETEAASPRGSECFRLLQLPDGLTIATCSLRGSAGPPPPAPRMIACFAGPGRFDPAGAACYGG
jgi:hypothetical protein